MFTKTKLDQNRLDFCVLLVNTGFVHVGTMWDQYDIYYDKSGDYTYEVGFPNDNQEFKVCEYVGKHRRDFGSNREKPDAYEPPCKYFVLTCGRGFCDLPENMKDDCVRYNRQSCYCRYQEAIE